jgi:hypothetical protein
MPGYSPGWALGVTPNDSTANSIGSLVRDFEAFQPDRNYSFQGRRPPYTWKLIQPKTGPAIGDLPLLIQNLIKSTWKFAEPTTVKGTSPGHVAHGITIGSRDRGVTIGTRGGSGPRPNGSLLYNPQVAPTTQNLEVKLGNDSAIASDWKLFNWIRRTNAVTFRGDSRSPLDVITRAGGFYPPNSRGDRYYLENNIYDAFASYLKRRYSRDLTKAEFLKAVDNTTGSKEHESLIIDYMMWRKITEREAVNLGRMVANECLKGYISTARSIDTSLDFATAWGSRSGWLYLNVVHAGFVVPGGHEHLWGSDEAEIAQWGPIPAERIVGFVKVKNVLQSGVPEGPIFIRRSFRLGEPAAFEEMFKVMSGKTPLDGAKSPGNGFLGAHRTKNG